jgi:methionine-rich copper-binding protein CopC
MKDFSVKDPRLDVNSMVLLKEPDDIKAKEHFVAKFSTPEKRYNRSLLEYNDQPSTFSSPDLTKKQHDEVKENQVKLKEYREKFFEVNRRNRIYQSNYRSGILGIDNPALE